MYSM
jgi:hypothetical protein